MKSGGSSTQKATRSSKAFAGILSGLVCMKASASFIFGADLFSNIETMMADLYGAIFAISTGLAALMILCALIVIMVTNNQRTTETAKSWAKRIVIVWLIINCLGYGMDMLQELTDGGANAEWNELTN
jgi:uncharacterized membrane protein YozB (DUF420 family)